jgi:hypothetical protein
LEDYLPPQSLSYEYSYAVHHSFGRGSFKAEAEGVVVPKVVLDRIISQKCWTERPRGHGRGSRGMGGAGSARPVASVTRADLRPKSSGRARALHMRVQKTAWRPGQVC